MDEDTLITSSRGALLTLDAKTLTLKKKYIHQTRANSVNKENQTTMLSSNTKKNTIKGYTVKQYRQKVWFVLDRNPPTCRLRDTFYR